MSWGVSAAVHAALETALSAEAEAVTYPPSVIEEAPSPSDTPDVFDVFLPRRRPTVVPPPAAPGDNATGSAPRPARPPREVPDLAVMQQVLQGLQRLA
ncbi:MAG: hypothetical protein JO016_02430 [Actinobacteria bacterium]|nr:hypothetical protein [Actinomycetota bacterium]